MGLIKQAANLIVILFLFGCAYDGFKHHYDKFPYTQQSAVNCDSDPVINSLSNPPSRALFYQMWGKGYTLIGSSEFWTTESVRKEDAIKQAKAVGACVILLYAKHAGTVSGYYPVFNYTPPAQYSTQYSGFYGNKFYQGTMTTQEQGSGTLNTTYVPYQKNKYEYSASYWAKFSKPRIGILLVELPEEMRKTLQRNTGLLIASIYEGSVAFNENILPGDVLINANGIEIKSQNDYRDFMAKFTNGKLNFVLLRDGKEVIKQLVVE